MSGLLGKLGFVGSAGQSPVAFPCSFAVSLPATASILQTGGAGTTGAPGIPDLLSASDSGASASDNLTSDATPAFRIPLPAQAAAGDTLRLYRAGSVEIGSKLLESGDIGAGFADVTASPALAAAAHTITARVENGAGLSPASAGLAIVIDTAAPDAPVAIVVAPADQGSGPTQTDNAQPSFRISLPANAAAGDLATLEIDGADDATALLDAGDIAAGFVDIQSAGVLADDTLYDISAFLTDAAGNQGSSNAPVAVEVGAAGGNAIPAVVYDGVQGFLKHTGGPAGAADGAALTIAWAGTFNSDGSAMTLLDIPGTVPVKLYRAGDDTIRFEGGAAGAVFANATAVVTASLGFLIVLASCNGTASTLKVVHAAGTIGGTNTPGSAATLDLTADWYLGADGGAAEFLDADTALWWIDDQPLDFDDADTIEQFWDTTNDVLRDPGADGSNPLDGDHAPLVCHKSAAASHTVNVGSGGDADTAGVFADGTSPGIYADDYVPVTLQLALVSSAEDDSGNTASSTFSAQSFGAAAASRVLYVVAAARAGLAGAGPPPDVTLDGNAMTLIGEAMHQVGSGERRVAIYSLAQSAMTNPNATSGDIVVTYSAGQHRGKAIAVYRGVGYSASASDTAEDEDGSDPLSDSLTAVANGMVIAGAAIDNNSAISWTAPLAQDAAFDVLFNGSKISFASATGLSAGPVTITADPATPPTTLGAMIAVTFNPV